MKQINIVLLLIFLFTLNINVNGQKTNNKLKNVNCYVIAMPLIDDTLISKDSTIRFFSVYINNKKRHISSDYRELNNEFILGDYKKLRWKSFFSSGFICVTIIYKKYNDSREYEYEYFMKIKKEEKMPLFIQQNNQVISYKDPY